MKSQHLTKSRFKVGFDCPTKLYYHDHPDYPSLKDDDKFLKMLADGGFQVGELAKLYHEGGEDLSSLEKMAAVKKTAELMKRKSVTIYEAAFLDGNCYVKVDVLKKEAKHVRLIEVKAKSFDSQDPPHFFAKKRKKPELIGKWRDYVLDVAFQGWVFRACHPELTLECFLMCADTASVATVDGLNQRFLLGRDAKGRSTVTVEPGTTLAVLGKQILKEIPLQEVVETVWGMDFPMGPFPKVVARLSRICEKQEFAEPVLSSDCKGCEFRIDEDLKKGGNKSGFEHCWQRAGKVKKGDLKRPFVFDLWWKPNAEKLVEAGVYFADQLIDLTQLRAAKKKEEPVLKDVDGLTRLGRQWEQVKQIRNDDGKIYFDKKGLAAWLGGLKWPFHCIDFETARVAIPFYKGQRPYEQIAYQFSHHVLHEDGRVEHRNDYLFFERGKFPNFEFVRALKTSLGKEKGTIFRYATHENTVLNDIFRQLEKSKEPDRKELQAFISEISTVDGVIGKRNMVDLHKAVTSFYLHPLMGGSNSIKAVLPAVLHESKFLRKKYGQAIYGASIPSRNFAKPVAWIQLEKDGSVKDPYSMLEPILSPDDERVLHGHSLMESKLADGGSAMMAFARMQFTQMTQIERDRVAKALLRYCELDTLAMVMLLEYWRNEVGGK